MNYLYQELLKRKLKFTVHPIKTRELKQFFFSFPPTTYTPLTFWTETSYLTSNSFDSKLVVLDTRGCGWTGTKFTLELSDMFKVEWYEGWRIGVGRQCRRTC